MLLIVTDDGYPAWNSFDGESWGEWGTYEDIKVKYQPAAYVYKDKVHVAYTGDDNHGYYSEYDGSWGEWSDLGENYDYDPYIYEYDGSAYLTYTGENGYAYTKEYTEEDGGY